MRRNIFGCIVAGTAAITALTFRPDTAEACNVDGYIGSICWTAIPYCPEGYLPADGRLLPINQYQGLYAVIMETYGKNNSRGEFNLPDMTGREPVGTGTGQGLTPINAGYPVGGPEQHRITAYQLPAHDHGVTIAVESGVDVKVQAGAGSEKTPAGNVLAAPEISSTNLYSDTADGDMAPGVVTANIAGQTVPTAATPTSSQTRISIVGPQLGMLACINYDGIYPTRG